MAVPLHRQHSYLKFKDSGGNSLGLYVKVQ